MRRVIEASRYIVIVAVFTLIVSAGIGFALGVVDTVHALKLLTQASDERPSTVALVKIMDTFVVASALLLFGIGLYGVFIERLELPAWRAMGDLDALKDRLAAVVVLALAVTFLEHVSAWTEPKQTLDEGIAIALVVASLLLFRKKA